MRTTLAFALSLAAAAAHGQGTIQKCVGADGKVSYQETPCDAKAKTAALLRRDRTQPDPAAMLRAQQERDRLDNAFKARAKQAADEDARREKLAEDERRAKEKAAAEDRADARERTAGQPIYQPTPIVVKEPIIERPAPPPAAPAPAPAPPRPQSCTGTGCPKK